jgi:hypothetical protein
MSVRASVPSTVAFLLPPTMVALGSEQDRRFWSEVACSLGCPMSVASSSPQLGSRLVHAWFHDEPDRWPQLIISELGLPGGGLSTLIGFLRRCRSNEHVLLLQHEPSFRETRWLRVHGFCAEPWSGTTTGARRVLTGILSDRERAAYGDPPLRRCAILTQ